MKDYKKMLEGIDEQESRLVFSEFTSETALKIGLIIIENAKKENKIITIDITKNGHQLFHYSFDGTSPDNDQWVARKNRVVNRFFKSSLYIQALLKHEGKSIEEKYHISFFDYCPYGGAFPIIIKNAGVVGTITVSGLTEEEDHDMVVRAIESATQVASDK
ncbi:MAG: heme-degrading domain-containing protein [Clostridium lundense]|nr:heme-degrading domain-containing protein [Clostridium lundense]